MDIFKTFLHLFLIFCLKAISSPYDDVYPAEDEAAKPVADNCNSDIYDAIQYLH